MGFAIKQKQSSRKFQSEDQSYQCKSQVAMANYILQAFSFKTKVTFQICLEAKHVKGYFAML